MLGKALLSASASAQKLYVEDVFSTYLYTGNGSTQTITNGIDLAGKGGLVWIKSRSAATVHRLLDTERGLSNVIGTSSASAQFPSTPQILNSYDSNGFILNDNAFSNNSGDTYASWTFRKAAKFFDVVTYVGNGSNRTIAHNLGSVPGCIIVKRTDTTGDWQVYHRANTANPETDYLVLNSTAATADSDTRWNDTLPTSTVFSLGTDATVNDSGGTYVAYLFAHDAGGFGDSGNDSVVSCGSYTGTGAAGNFIDLGWEPQWLLIKSAEGGTGNWIMFDIMRGIFTGSNTPLLSSNTSNAESNVAEYVNVNSRGFALTTTATGFNASGRTYIYIAIRRGPMKTPTDATKVFKAVTYIGTGSAFDVTSPGFPVDLAINKERSLFGGGGTQFQDRLRGALRNLGGTTTAAESVLTGSLTSFASMTGFSVGTNASFNYSGQDYVDWSFRRAPGFFDVVAYTGTGANRSLSHNLGVIPELMIAKKRSGADNWPVYSAALGTGVAAGLRLNTTDSAGYNNGTRFYQTPTASLFYVGTDSDINASGQTYITYLFATCPGVSKVFSFTGTGTTLQIDCGFTNGARLVLIKRTMPVGSTGDWYIWDSARGIISGNDPYLLLNSTAAEVTNTDYIDPYSAGFEISSTAPAAINANGGSYIGLAIA